MFDFIHEKAITDMKRALSNVFDFKDSGKDKLEAAKLDRYKSEYRLKFRNWFFKSKRPTGYDDIALPTPFIKLWNMLVDLDADYAISIGQGGAFYGIFWRLYACYRHGLDYDIVRKQIEMAVDTSEDMEEFWCKAIYNLKGELKPYILYNRYLVIPINRILYFIDHTLKRSN